MTATLEQELRKALGDEAVPAVSGEYLTDMTLMPGRADAVVLPASAQEVARIVAWCYDHDVPITPRGGGTGVAAGAVPLDGGVVLGLVDQVAARRAWQDRVGRDQRAQLRQHAAAGLVRLPGYRLAPRSQPTRHRWRTRRQPAPSRARR